MTKEEKELLFKDLSARLPYGVLCDFAYNIGHPQKLLSISLNEKYQIRLDSDEYVFGSGKSYGPSVMMIQDCKPYLRPMTSMTEEEEQEYYDLTHQDEDDIWGKCLFDKMTDFCNQRHLDYRGLIPMGLALEAPEDMYKEE